MWRICGVSLLLAACSVAATFPEYPVRPATEYKAIVTKSGLTVAYIPVDDPDEQRKYFGLNLKAKGYLPVMLVIENRAVEDSFLLNKDDLLNLENFSKQTKTEKTIKAASYFSIYGMMARMATSKIRALKQNILKSELQSTTLSPGSSAHGFVFVKAHWKKSVREPLQLAIPFLKSGTDEIVTIDLAF